MRVIPLLLLGSTLAACAPHPPAAHVDPYGAARLNALVGGKVAGAPLRCLPGYRISNVQVIDSTTIAYHAGAQVFVNRLRGTCGPLAQNNHTITTKPFGFGGPCNGDLIYLTDSSGITVGSCMLGDFVPYAPARL